MISSIKTAAPMGLLKMATEPQNGGEAQGLPFLTFTTTAGERRTIVAPPPTGESEKTCFRCGAGLAGPVAEMTLDQAYWSLWLCPQCTHYKIEVIVENPDPHGGGFWVKE